MCKVLVCGGRDFTDTEFIYAALDHIDKKYMIETVIEGDARGVDRIAGYWARKNKKDNLKFPADWDTHGKAAGFIRNRQMLDLKPDIVIVFPGGKGTAHTRNLAYDRGLKVIEISP